MLSSYLFDGFMVLEEQLPTFAGTFVSARLACVILGACIIAPKRVCEARNVFIRSARCKTKLRGKVPLKEKLWLG